MARLTIYLRLSGPRPPRGGGLFPRDSVLRRLASESVCLLGGGRSLLMQIAHPMVAAGVADHSDFRRDPLARLERTLEVSLGIVLGDEEHARQVLRHFHSVHVPVRGRLSHDAGPFPAGTPYHAHDPELKLWVHATLVDGTLRVYELFVRRLSPHERTRYYEDSRLLARYYGVPESLVPPTLEEFDAYMREMMEGDTLAVTETTREIAKEVLHPTNVWAVPRAFGPLARFVTAGLLPERLRRAYGLRWDSRRQAVLDSLSRAIRLGLPLMPPALRLMPQAGGGRLIQWAIRGPGLAVGRGGSGRQAQRSRE